MESGAPLTFEYLQKILPKPAGEVSHFGEFFNAVAQSVAIEMQLYNSVPVKCEVIGEKSGIFGTPEEARSCTVLLSKSGKIHIWFSADRSFDQLLCELCLGGTGVPEPDEEGVRPPSNFERRFRLNLLRKLLALVPLAAKRASNAELEVAVTDEAENITQEKYVNKSCLEVVLQLSAFTFTSEISLQFIESELVQSLDTSGEPDATKKVTARSVLDDCRFNFEAYLKPREIALQEVIMLKVGQVIPLGIGISEPIALSCEGKPVFQAVIDLSGDKIGLSLLNEIGTNRRNTDVIG